MSHVCRLTNDEWYTIGEFLGSPRNWIQCRQLNHLLLGICDNIIFESYVDTTLKEKRRSYRSDQGGVVHVYDSFPVPHECIQYIHGTSIPHQLMSKLVNSFVGDEANAVSLLVPEVMGTLKSYCDNVKCTLPLAYLEDGYDELQYIFDNYIVLRRSDTAIEEVVDVLLNIVAVDLQRMEETLEGVWTWAEDGDGDLHLFTRNVCLCMSRGDTRQSYYAQGGVIMRPRLPVDTPWSASPHEAVDLVDEFSDRYDKEDPAMLYGYASGTGVYHCERRENTSSFPHNERTPDLVETLLVAKGYTALVMEETQYLEASHCVDSAVTAYECLHWFRNVMGAFQDRRLVLRRMGPRDCGEWTLTHRGVLWKSRDI
eukprot:PhF_6_TR39681/c0_g2_i2/m.58955